MKRIIKYRSWFLTIGWILTVIFSPRLLDNPWALYAGETLLAIGLNMIFLSDKKKMENRYLQHHCRYIHHWIMAMFDLFHN